MKFGVQISRQLTGDRALLQWISSVGDAAGLDSVWTSESYGWEAFTPLAWTAAKTEHVRLATGIAAMPARAPAAAAMAAMTLDHLCGGRAVLGLGVSGPRVAEGWYGQPFGHPLRRTREYVEIVRRAVRRAGPLDFQGEYYRIPATDATTRALQSFLHPLRDQIPIYLGAQGPKNIALSAEIADGMVTGWFSPRASDWIQARLKEGFARSTRPDAGASFELGAIVDVAVAPTVREAANRLRPHVAFHVAKMGPRGSNFYYDTFVRLGYEQVCEQIVTAYQQSPEAAAELVPDEMAREGALAGPLDTILADLDAWDDTCCDLVVLRGDSDELIHVLTALLR